MNAKSAPIRSVIDQLYRGRLPAVERALNNALGALNKGADPCAALRQSAKILRAAHWVSALHFNNVLLSAWSQVATSSQAQSPQASDDDQSVENHIPLAPVLSAEAFQTAISDFLEAIQYSSVQEFAWSSRIAKHYSSLCACKAQSVAIFVEECARAGRVMPSAVFHTLRSDEECSVWLTKLRARYERALFALLNTSNEEAPLDGAAQEELEACLRVWLIPEGGELYTYDIGRLVESWIHMQHQVNELGTQVPSSLAGVFNAQTRRIYALLNPLWVMKALKKVGHGKEKRAEYTERTVVVPASCVQALVISLWGMFSVYRRQAEATEASIERITELLADYCVATPIKGVVSNASDNNAKETVSFSKALAWWEQIGLSESQRLGVLELNQDAYENLQVQAQHSAKTLSDALQAFSTAKEASANTLQLSEEIGRWADLAYTVGLGDVAFFAQQLAMAWRYQFFGDCKVRSDELIHVAMVAMLSGDNEEKATQKAPSSVKEGQRRTNALSAQKATIDSARTTLLDLTYRLQEGLEALSDGEIPKQLTKAHQQVLATVMECRY